MKSLILNRLIKLGGKLDCEHLAWSENDKNIFISGTGSITGSGALSGINIR